MKVITDISTLVVQTPEICGGRPRIEGSRITVQNIVIDIKAGLSPEEILESKTHLNLAKIYAALAYYYANKEAIDADINSEEGEWEKIEAEFTVNK
jgi:uncharacterized protein (DUF433 family)